MAKAKAKTLKAKAGKRKAMPKAWLAPRLLREDLQALGKNLMNLSVQVSLLERSLKATQATVSQWRESPDRGAVTSDHDRRIRHLEDHQNTIDGREIRLIGAIEKAVIAEAQANALIRRFEKGLNTAIERAMAGGVADLVAEITTPQSGNWYTEAYAEAHNQYKSSIRS